MRSSRKVILTYILIGPETAFPKKDFKWRHKSEISR